MRATRAASDSERAPVTLISTKRDAPSPSRTTACDNSSATASSPSRKARKPRPVRAIGGLPAAAFARTATVSLVLQSPSTVMQLKVFPTVSRSARRSRAARMAQSVVMKQSMVAMFGAIIPEPLAMPPMRTGLPPMRTLDRGRFGDEVGGHDRASDGVCVRRSPAEARRGLPDARFDFRRAGAGRR